MDESKRFSELLGNFLDETAVTLSTLSSQCQNFANQCEKEGLVPPHPGTIQRALLALMNKKEDFDMLYVGGNKSSPQNENDDNPKPQESPPFLKTPLPNDIKIDPRTPKVLASILKVIGRYPKATPEYLVPNLKYEFPDLTDEQALTLSQYFVPIVSKVLK